TRSEPSARERTWNSWRSDFSYIPSRYTRSDRPAIAKSSCDGARISRSDIGNAVVVAVLTFTECHRDSLRQVPGSAGYLAKNTSSADRQNSRDQAFGCMGSVVTRRSWLPFESMTAIPN